MTKRPMIAERLTVVLFEVPRPTVSVEVVRWLRRAVEAFTKRSVRALLLTVRAMVAFLSGQKPVWSTTTPWER